MSLFQTNGRISAPPTQQGNNQESRREVEEQDEVVDIGDPEDVDQDDYINLTCFFCGESFETNKAVMYHYGTAHAGNYEAGTQN